MPKEKQIARLLLKYNLKLATAESCTGGLISSRMTDVSGSSAYINQNLITYANSAKIKLLGVNAETIEKHGAVSSEVASEMALGLLERYDCNLAISTTGIAGPTGATDKKPVGLVYMAIVYKDICKIYKFDNINELAIPFPTSSLVLGCCKTIDLYTSLLDAVLQTNSVEIFSLSNNIDMKNNYQIIVIYQK